MFALFLEPIIKHVGIGRGIQSILIAQASLSAANKHKQVNGGYNGKYHPRD